MVEIEGLVAAYGEITALHGLSLRVGKDAIVTVLGSNGAGKTTLLRCLSGLLKPRAGQIRLNGRRIDGLEPERIVGLGVSHVPEGRLIFPSLTVRDNLAMGGYLGKRRQVEAGIDRVCEYFPILRERLRQMGGTLSGGEQQMLAIARALVLTPVLLLLDEPSMGVAPRIKEQIFEQLRAIRDHERTTVVLVEQDADVALSIAEYAYVLVTGRVAMEARSDDLIANDELRRAYLGG
jgi:branched-chain amino acid transport system ATP-binding protein